MFGGNPPTAECYDPSEIMALLESPSTLSPYSDDKSISVLCDERRWGGARHRGNAESTTITRKQCLKVMTAAERALKAGRPLNWFLTVNWRCLGIPPESVVHATRALIKLIREYLRMAGLPWTWVQEVGRRYGHHVHVLLYIPPERLEDVNRLWRRNWQANLIRQFSPNGPPASMRGAKCGKKLGGSLRLVDINPALYRAHLNRVVVYMLKGASRETLKELGLRQKHRNCGRTTGKRVACWPEPRKRRNTPTSEAQS